MKRRFVKRLEARRWRKVYTWWKRQCDCADERFRVLVFPAMRDARHERVHRLIKTGRASADMWITGKCHALAERPKFTERKGPLLTGPRRLGRWGQ